MILLDTCAILWLDSGRHCFTRPAMSAIRRHSDSLAASPISFMEIGIKMNSGKLRLPLPLDQWVEQLTSRYAFLSMPVSAQIAVAAAMLPEIHRDPTAI